MVIQEAGLKPINVPVSQHIKAIFPISTPRKANTPAQMLLVAFTAITLLYIRLSTSFKRAYDRQDGMAYAAENACKTSSVASLAGK